MRRESFTYEQRANVSVVFGLLFLAVAWIVDLRRWRGGDFAFWLHFFGLMAFWGGLTAQNSGSKIGKAIYCLMNVGLVFLALFLMRRVYAVFGAVGISLYLGPCPYRKLCPTGIKPRIERCSASWETCSN